MSERAHVSISVHMQHFKEPVAVDYQVLLKGRSHLLTINDVNFFVSSHKQAKELVARLASAVWGESITIMPASEWLEEKQEAVNEYLEENTPHDVG